MIRNVKVKNELIIVRQTRGLTRKQASSLLGFCGTTALMRYEQGRARPDLETLLRLEILYRTPVAFLYPDLYCGLRDALRDAEGVAERSRRW